MLEVGAAVRVYSDLNEQIDFVIFVGKDEDIEEAKGIIEITSAKVSNANKVILADFFIVSSLYYYVTTLIIAHNYNIVNNMIKRGCHITQVML